MQSTVDMTKLSPKKHSIRFDTDDEDAPVKSIYVERWWVMNADGAPNGVRVTIEPLP